MSNDDIFDQFEDDCKPGGVLYEAVFIRTRIVMKNRLGRTPSDDEVHAEMKRESETTAPPTQAI